VDIVPLVQQIIKQNRGIHPPRQQVNYRFRDHIFQSSPLPGFGFRRFQNTGKNYLRLLLPSLAHPIAPVNSAMFLAAVQPFLGELLLSALRFFADQLSDLLD
jgi:hypothetical protein